MDNCTGTTLHCISYTPSRLEGLLHIRRTEHLPIQQIHGVILQIQDVMLQINVIILRIKRVIL